jgi:hypothetical protein
MHNFSSLLNIALHVSDGLSAHHYEFKTLHTTSGICHTGSLTAYYEAVNKAWLLPAAMTVWQITHAVDTVVCAPDDGWWYHPKHVE